MFLAKPGFFAIGFEVEEYEQEEGGGEVGETELADCVGEGSEGDTAVEGMADDAVGACLDELAVVFGVGKWGKVLA